MENKRIIIIGGPSSIGKSSVLKYLSEKYKLKYLEKELQKNNLDEIDLLGIHYSFNLADEKYLKENIPKKEDFLFQHKLNFELDFFRSINEKQDLNLFCLYANPEIILKRAIQRKEEIERRPRSLDLNIIKLETESEISKWKFITRELFGAENYKFLINTANKSISETAEEIYFKANQFFL